jgi:DNA-binding HxlR family transcriptional regulator
MATQRKKIPAARRPPASGMVESIVGCKWSLRVLDLVRGDVCRPGAMERGTPGLSAKVLNERLKKLTRYGILEKTVFPESPPRVEYRLTAFGQRFTAVLDAILALDQPAD